MQCGTWVVSRACYVAIWWVYIKFIAKHMVSYPRKLIFGHFEGAFRNFWKNCQGTSQYYVPILNRDPNFGGACFIAFFIDLAVLENRGKLKTGSDDINRRLKICSSDREKPSLSGVCFMTFIHISIRLAIISNCAELHPT